MIPTFIYLTQHPTNSPAFYGDQIFLQHLLKGRVQEFMSDPSLTEEPKTSGAIVSIRAADNMEYIDKINRYLDKFDWCIVVITANEDSSDFHKMIKHKNCKIWLQTPKDGDVADFFLPLGFPSSELTHEYQPTKEGKELDWFFAGQITHSRRQQCMESLMTIPNGRLVQTDSFNSGLAYMDYINLMRKSKVVPCPGGSISPDTFRVYEALQCGAIPILDAYGGYSVMNDDYWVKIFGKDHPLIVETNWQNVDYSIDFIVNNYDEIWKKTMTWWHELKQNITDTLFLHIKELTSYS